MRSPGTGRPTKAVGFEVPPHTTALVTSHLPCFAASTSCQPSRFLPFSKGLHPLSVRNGGSPLSLPSFNAEISAAPSKKTNAPASNVARAVAIQRCLKCALLRSEEHTSELQSLRH